MRTTNILHITDLHFKSDRAHNQRVVLDALLDDIKLQSVRVGEPDLVVFSGDLVHNADDENVYDKLYDDLLDPLLDAVNCDHSRLYLVPGNHDIQRTQVQSLKTEQREFTKYCATRDTLNERYFDGSIGKFARNKCSIFYEFQSFFEAEGTIFANEFVQVYDLPEKGISMLCMNTSWMGNAGLDKVSDLRNLLLPEASLVEAFHHVPQGRFVVGVQHHPTNWLAEFCETDFKDYLGGKIDLQLIGHVHDPRPIVFREASGTTFQNQAGALYTWREDRYLGYSLIRIAPEKKFIEVCWRSYYDKRRCFDEATNVNKNSGWLYSSDAAESHFRDLFDDFKKLDVKQWVENVVKPQIEGEFEKGMHDRPTTEFFVAPPLHKQTFIESKKEEDCDEFVKQEIDFDDLSRSSDNVIIQSHPEYGRTTLLQQLCVDGCSTERVERKDRHFVPVFLKFSDFAPGTKRVEKAIRNALPDLPPSCTIETLLSNGVFSIFVDDVLFSNVKGMAELRSFVSTFKSNRFILSTLQLRQYDGVQIDVGLPVHFERVTMSPFRRKDIRSLVKKWDTPSETEEELLERVVRELRAINVPYTPVNSTLLLDIISNDHAFSPLNRPALIERFIETLLKKRSISEIERRKFDFRNQIHFLGHIAKYMCRTNEYVLKYEKLFIVTDDYLKNLGLNYGAREIIDISIASRIFAEKKPDNLISFRFRAFLEFFVAAQMRADVEFRQWVFDDARFLSYLNEIEYYAGLERNDLDLLQLISERHERCLQEVFGEKFLDLFNSEGDKMIPTSLNANMRYAGELADQIGEQPMSAAERDEVLDADIPQDAEGRQEVFRPNPTSPHSKYILSLRMYTTLVKNTELVADSDKRRHLASVLRSWALAVHGSFLAIPSLVKNRRMNVNGLNYIVSYPRNYSDERVAKLISLNIPIEIARLLYLLIGTEKLEIQLRQATVEEDKEPRLVEFFRSSLYIDLRFKQWWKVPGRFTQEMKDSYYFQEVMLGKAVDVYRLGAYSKPIEAELQEEIIDSYARLYAHSAEQVQKLRNKKKESMRRTKNLNALRAIIDKE